MNCPEARDLFSARADDHLTPQEGVALEAHFQACVACRHEWERFERTVGLLRAVEEARAPAGFAQRVIGAASRESRRRPILRRLFLPLHVKLPLEAAAVVVVSTVVILLFRQTPELQRAPEVVAPPPVAAPAAPTPKPAEPEHAQAPTPAPRREVGPPPAVPPAPRPESGAVARPEPSREGDRLKKKEAEERGAQPSAEGRTDASRQALKAAPEPRALEFRARGPFHVVGALRPKDSTTLEAQLNDLVKLVGGTLVPEGGAITAGSIVEILVSREAYPRVEAGLRQIGDFTTETQAHSFPEQLRIAIRVE